MDPSVTHTVRLVRHFSEYPSSECEAAMCPEVEWVAVNFLKLACAPFGCSHCHCPNAAPWDWIMHMGS